MQSCGLAQERLASAKATHGMVNTNMSIWFASFFLSNFEGQASTPDTAVMTRCQKKKIRFQLCTAGLPRRLCHMQDLSPRQKVIPQRKSKTVH